MRAQSKSKHQPLELGVRENTLAELCNFSSVFTLIGLEQMEDLNSSSICYSMKDLLQVSKKKKGGGEGGVVFTVNVHQQIQAYN